MLVCLYVGMDATYAYALDMDCAVLIQAGFRRVLYIFFGFGNQLSINVKWLFRFFFSIFES